jgi:hypothetical protein
MSFRRDRPTRRFKAKRLGPGSKSYDGFTQIEKDIGIRTKSALIPARTLTVDRLRTIWTKIRSDIYSPRVLAGLPDYAVDLAQTWAESDEQQVLWAVRTGDVGFFVAFLLRLEAIHAAMERTNATTADKLYLLRIKVVLEGLREAAEERLGLLVAAANEGRPQPDKAQGGEPLP